MRLGPSILLVLLVKVQTSNTWSLDPIGNRLPCVTFGFADLNSNSSTYRPVTSNSTYRDRPVTRENCSDIAAGDLITYYRQRSLNSSSGVDFNVDELARTVFRNCDKSSTRLVDIRVSEDCELKLCDLREGVSQGNYDDSNLDNCTNVLDTFSGNRRGRLKLSEVLSHRFGRCSCEAKIDPDWIGLIYSPYTKYPEKCQAGLCHATWPSYSDPEIRKQLQLMATKFTQISTYGMGSEPNTTWKNASTELSRVPLKVAEMNKVAGFHRLRVLIGVFRQPDYDDDFAVLETENAISATIETNLVFPETVWGISVQVNFKTDEFTFQGFDKALRAVKTAKSALRNSTSKNVQVGIRLTECDRALVSQGRTEDEFALYCPKNDTICRSNLVHLNSSLYDLIKSSDFVVCILKPMSTYPTSALNETTKMVDIVESVGEKLIKFRTAARKLNKAVGIIGETGWPSEGRSSNKLPNTLRNLRHYWYGISDWAKVNQMQLFMFEAFDEPWKNNPNKLERLEINGNCGSEAYYGFWKRTDNSDPGIYYEKISELTNDTLSSDDLIEKASFSKDCVVDEESEGQKPRMSSWTIVLPGIVAGLGSVFLLIVSCMAYRLQKAQRSEATLSRKYLEMFLKGLPANEVLTEGDYNVIALQFPYDKRKYELPKENFKIDESIVIGKGQSGTVYRGRIQGLVSEVAFKTTGTSSSILDIKNLLSEIKIMSYIGEHENIVCLLGAFTEKLEKGIVYIALELCDGGSLDKFLLKNRNDYRQVSPGGWGMSNSRHFSISSSNYAPRAILNPPPLLLNYVTTAKLNDDSNSGSSDSLECSSTSDFQFQFTTLLSWAFEISNGMAFLASKKVIHADLATRNILLTSCQRVKIMDFGLSRKLYHEMGETFEPEVPLPWRWMAPESLRHLTFSTETDVWSYGVTLWEIFSLGDVPYPALSFSNQFIDDLETGFRMDTPKHATPQIYHLLVKCWKLCPRERPAFTDLRAEFQNLLLADQI